MTKQLQH